MKPFTIKILLAIAFAANQKGEKSEDRDDKEFSRLKVRFCHLDYHVCGFLWDNWKVILIKNI